MKSSFLSIIFISVCLLFRISSINAESPFTEIAHSQKESQSKRLKINIIYKQNQTGLGKDGELLANELKKLGHSIRKYKIAELKPLRQADINLFLERFNKFFFPFASKNYIIPNPEWFFSPEYIPQFDMILCKTREAERIFKELHPNTVFISFTCLDRYNKSIKKNYRSIIHVGGTSEQKGTNAIVQAWSNNPLLPKLMLIKSKTECDFPTLENMKVFCDYIDEPQLKYLQNQSGIHLCPSETEGFGHYIMEAFSCGAVVVTTDAPPMTEFVLDKRCLAGYSHTSIQRLATNYYVDPNQLAIVVEELMNLSDKELQDIGRKNREFYLQNKLFFEQRLAEVFGDCRTID